MNTGNNFLPPTIPKWKETKLFGVKGAGKSMCTPYYCKLKPRQTRLRGAKKVQLRSIPINPTELLLYSLVHPVSLPHTRRRNTTPSFPPFIPSVRITSEGGELSDTLI